MGIFDKNESLTGEIVEGVPISNIRDMASFCRETKPVIAILCIPKTAAQSLADELVKLGIKAFWNFSHYDLKMDYDGIIVENVHLGDSLLTLSYGVNNLLDGDDK